MIKLRTATVIALGLSMAACTSPGADGGESMGGQSAGSQSASASGSVQVGGADMFPTRTIVENASNSPIHTTLVAAVTAAGLAPTLSGAGPFTVFAPTNDAFARLPAGTVDTLLRPENRATLTSILTYHVVPGRLSAADIMSRITAGGGSAQLTTVNGAALTARMSGGNLTLTDGRGGTSTVTQGDVFQSNGVIHVTDAVSQPA